MSDRLRMLGGMASLGASRVLWRGLGAIIMILLARHLGVELFGVYAAAFSFASLASMFTEVGLGQVVLRSVARDEADRGAVFGNSLLLKLTLIALAFGAMMAASRLIGHDARMSGAVAIVGIGVFATAAHQIPIVVLQGLQRMQIVAAFQAGASVLALIAVGAAISAEGDLFSVALAQSLSNLLPLPLMLLVAAQAIRPRFDRSSMKPLLREGAPFGVLAALYLVLQQGPVLFLERLGSPQEVGLSSAAFRPVALLYVIPQVVSSVLVPRMFKHAVEDQEQHHHLSLKLLSHLSTLGIAISALVFVGAELVIGLLFGAEYAGSAPLIRILCWFLALQCLSYPLGDMLTTADFNRPRIAALAAACSVLIIGNALAIPTYGAQGAALVTLAAEATLVVISGFFVKRVRPEFPLLRTIAPRALAAAALIAAWYSL
jgi:O-antigen/teichoic acid export membrane protein